MMQRRIFLTLTGAAALQAAAGGAAVHALQLIMVEEDGCIWCEQWNRDIGPIYPKTAEGRMAPLRRVDLRATLPADLKFTRPPFYTPTFILVRDGQELSRIEGYPGEAFFWGLLGKMLKENTDFQGAS